MKPLVNRLSYASVQAQDPLRLAEDTANIVGARIVGEEGGAILMSANQRHAEFIIHQGTENLFRACGLEACNAAAVREVRDRARDAGLHILSETPSLACIADSVTFATSEGHVFEVHTPMPHDRSVRFHGPGAHAKCLDHLNFTARNPEVWAQELSAACGLLLSERTSGYEISWMRAADGRHHTIAAVKGDSGVHHISWEFNSFQDFRSLGDNLAVEDRRLVWGPGRHGAGDNLFLYYRDSAGFLIECIAEMEVILDEAAPTRVVEPGENLSNWKVVNQWGHLPPMDWVQHHNRMVEADTCAA